MEVVLKNVSFSYIDNVVFNNLNIRFNSNSITGIIGNNGSGKTTLLNIIAGYLKYKGDVINNNLTSYFNNIIDYNKTVYDVLDIEDKLFSITDILKVLNFDLNKMNDKLFLLSDGEIKKIIICYTLIQNKDLYLLDNPNNGLDYKSRMLLIKFLRNLKIKYNKTIIISSNDIDFIHEVVDQVLLLNNSPIIDDKYKIFTNEKLMSNYDIPNIIDISNIIYKNKNIKIGYRDDIKDLIKDIYRYAK